MKPSAYLICATPRSGSTLLCDLLAGTGVAGRPASYYRRQSIPSWATRLGVSLAEGTETPAFDRPYLNAVREEGTAGTGVLGLRLMWDARVELSGRLQIMFPGLPNEAARFEHAFGPLLWLHLTRLDKVAQAVSRLKAEQTGLWHVAADRSERERVAPSQPARYDADRLDGFIREASADAAWRTWFAWQSIEPL